MPSSLHMSSLSAMGISWFTPAGWRELQAVAEDELADTYEAFVRQTEKSIKEYEAQGYAVTKVLIDVPHMTAWCQRHGLRVNSSSRAAYGAMLLAADGDRNELDCNDLQGVELLNDAS